VRELYAQGTSQRALARMFGVPKTTMANYLKSLRSSPTPPQPTVMAQHFSDVRDSTPDVHTGIQPAMLQDLQELVAWWQTRKATLQNASEGDRQTERITFHVEKRWIEAIRRRSDLEGLTYTQLVNQAFQQFFGQKST